MHYDCRIDGDALICTLTPDRALSGAVFCCSGMATLAVVAGGQQGRTLGSYVEIALPDIAAGTAHEITIKYAGGYTPTNRAWMPMGPYLRIGAEVLPLPATRMGRDVPPFEKPEQFEGLALVPQPTDWQPAGQTVAVDGFASAGAAFDAASALARRQGMDFAGAYPVALVDADLPQDAYHLHITPDGATIAAASYGGQFYGFVTLMLLLRQGPLPCGVITDEPRFGWRGQHLDTARHYYDPASIRALLDLMALLKLNRFHWHFADDEAIRITLDSLPELAAQTAQRGEGQLLPAIFAGAPVQGGIYTKDQARDLITYAAAVNIEVMPEIETPAHALALTAVYPDTRDPGDNGQEKSVQGYHRNVLNPAMPRSWEIWHAMIDEIAALFPFSYLHLGCDELPADTWLSSPRARELMAREGLETTKDLQGWTIAKLAAHAVAQGKQVAAWEEAAQGSNGGIGHGALLFSWTGQGPGMAAAAAGYDVVMTPAQHTYFDMAHTSDPNDWGASWAAFVDLPDTVNWNPVPDPALADRIKGVQGAFWSEFTTEDSQMWPMLMPRMLGVAMMAWQDAAPQADQLQALAGHYVVDDQGRLD